MAQGKTGVKSETVIRSEKKVAKHVESVPRKAAIADIIPVPQTDTGGKGENPKAGGGSIAKELGKMAP